MGDNWIIRQLFSSLGSSVDQGTSIRTACSCFLGFQSLEGKWMQKWNLERAAQEGRMQLGWLKVVFWQKPLCSTTLCTKIHDLRSASPLGAFRGKGKRLEQGFVLQKKRNKKNPLLALLLVAVSYLVPRMRCLSRRLPCGQRRKPEPEPRETSQLLQQAGLGRRGLWEPLAAAPPAWVTCTDPDPLCRGVGLLQQMARGGVRPARPSRCSCIQGTFHPGHPCSDVWRRWLMVPPLPILSCFWCSCFACCLMFHPLMMCTLGLP